jgi:hypothetical protein
VPWVYFCKSSNNRISDFSNNRKFATHEMYLPFVLALGERLCPHMVLLDHVAFYLVSQIPAHEQAFHSPQKGGDWSPAGSVPLHDHQGALWHVQRPAPERRKHLLNSRIRISEISSVRKFSHLLLLRLHNLWCLMHFTASVMIPHL